MPNPASILKRSTFRTTFGTSGPVVLPVIHVLDIPRTLANIEVLREAGAGGCFLINHDFGIDPFLPIIRAVRRSHPELWLGLNFLATTGKIAFPILALLSEEDCPIDAYWADDACINEHSEDQTEAEAIAAVRQQSGWQGLYFGGTAFKKQRPVAPQDYAAAAKAAGRYMDVVTTSGIATGHAAEIDKIATFRRGVGDRPLALASGITPENAVQYRDVDCFMVATGINRPDNFYDIDRTRLADLLKNAAQLGIGHPS